MNRSPSFVMMKIMLIGRWKLFKYYNLVILLSIIILVILNLFLPNITSKLNPATGKSVDEFSNTRRYIGNSTLENYSIFGFTGKVVDINQNNDSGEVLVTVATPEFGTFAINFGQKNHPLGVWYVNGTTLPTESFWEIDTVEQISSQIDIGEPIIIQTIYDWDDDWLAQGCDLPGSGCSQFLDLYARHKSTNSSAVNKMINTEKIDSYQIAGVWQVVVKR